MDRNLIRNNITSVAIVIFLILFVVFQITSPSFLYDNDGALRKFNING